jgi:hypothetical protein
VIQLDLSNAAETGYPLVTYQLIVGLAIKNMKCSRVMLVYQRLSDFRQATGRETQKDTCSREDDLFLVLPT